MGTIMYDAMLVGNYALVRIFVLRFVIPYARTLKVNSYAMKLHPPCVHIFVVSFA
jgi:hypothetical protein